MNVSYDYWRDALNGQFAPVHDGEAHPGFYRRRMQRNGGFVPAAIWSDGDTLRCLVDGHEREAAAEWSHLCRHPVTEADYRHRVETGKWPDEADAVSESLVHDEKNEPKDPAKVLADQIDSALAGVDEFAKVGDDEAAAKAQSLRSRLLELSGDAEKSRVKLKQPHLDAGRAVDEAWQPLVKAAKAGADKIRAALSAFETAKERKRQAEEAERLRAAQEAETKRQALEAAGKPAPPPVPEAPAPAPQPVQTQIKGGYGRAATIKMIKKARIVDYSKAVIALSGHPEMKELVEKLAQRAVTAGVMVDGVEFDEVKDVR